MNTGTQANARIFSITGHNRGYQDSRYHLTSHTLHIREWGLEVVADSGEISGFPWAAVHCFTIGHISD